jgi:hypothetical protein
MKMNVPHEKVSKCTYVEKTENIGHNIFKIRCKWKIRTQSVHGGYKTE